MGTIELPPVLPRHVAIIMDGNGRWAARRGLPRSAGHAAGSENFRKIATFCRDIGIPYLTVYAFSTENWKRPEDEIETLLKLFRKYLHESLAKMEKNRVRLRFLGDLAPLPEDIRQLIARTQDVSSRYDGCTLQICLNYGARDEIVRACRSLLDRPPDELTEETFAQRLDSAGAPDPDLCIRPSGECRLSNFLLWQLAYAELFFVDALWPDFGKKELIEVLWAYAGRQRRFGGIS